MTTLVRWYRNASEKDADQARGEGELLDVAQMPGLSESIAIIIDGEGCFHECPLSLVRKVVDKPKAPVKAKGVDKPATASVKTASVKAPKK